MKQYVQTDLQGDHQVANTLGRLSSGTFTDDMQKALPYPEEASDLQIGSGGRI
jgi:hypothetical protein